MSINWQGRGGAPRPGGGGIRLGGGGAGNEPSGLRRLLAGLVRTGAGWGASIPAMEPGLGSAVGAGIAGAGESMAEFIEGSPQNKGRIAVEAALGAVPLGKIFTGRPLQSALRSGALAAVGEGGRELSEGQEPDLGRIGMSGGLGALLGGILGNFPRNMEKTPPAGPGTPPLQVETTSVTGGRTLGGGKVNTMRGGGTRLTGARPMEVTRPLGGGVSKSWGDVAPVMEAETGQFRLPGMEPAKVTPVEPGYTLEPVEVVGNDGRTIRELLTPEASGGAKGLAAEARRVQKAKGRQLLEDALGRTGAQAEEPRFSMGLSDIDEETGLRTSMSVPVKTAAQRRAAEEAATGEGGSGGAKSDFDAINQILKGETTMSGGVPAGKAPVEDLPTPQELAARRKWQNARQGIVEQPKIGGRLGAQVAQRQTQGATNDIDSQIAQLEARLARVQASKNEDAQIIGDRIQERLATLKQAKTEVPAPAAAVEPEYANVPTDIFNSLLRRGDSLDAIARLDAKIAAATPEAREAGFAQLRQTLGLGTPSRGAAAQAAVQQAGGKLGKLAQGAKPVAKFKKGTEPYNIPPDILKVLIDKGYTVEQINRLDAQAALAPNKAGRFDALREKLGIRTVGAGPESPGVQVVDAEPVTPPKVGDITTDSKGRRFRVTDVKDRGEGAWSWSGELVDEPAAQAAPAKGRLGKLAANQGAAPAAPVAPVAPVTEPDLNTISLDEVTQLLVDAGHDPVLARQAASEFVNARALEARRGTTRPTTFNGPRLVGAEPPTEIDKLKAILGANKAAGDKAVTQRLGRSIVPEVPEFGSFEEAVSYFRSTGISPAEAEQAAGEYFSNRSAALENPGAVAPRMGAGGPEGQIIPKDKVFKSRKGAAGKHFRELKTQLEAGGPNAPPAEAVAIAGRGSKEAQQAARAEQGITAGDWVKEQQAYVDEASRAGGFANLEGDLIGTPDAKLREMGVNPDNLTPEQREFIATGRAPQAPEPPTVTPPTPKNPGGRLRGKRGESGFASPGLLGRAGLSGLGALVGGAAGAQVGHPFLGMAAGAGLGALTPDIVGKTLSSLGASPDAISQALATVTQQTPEGTTGATPELIRETAKNIYKTLPQVQRFNYLADVTGLPANMWVGPYGSAIMAGIEHLLKGDSRGLALLKTMTPARFAREWQTVQPEAEALIASRAETSPVAGQFGKWLEAPGEAMTRGDLAARNIMKEVGFTEDEARTITLTSEPVTPFFRGVAEFGKKSPLAQLLFPFRRTPANVGEQGMTRIPGFGLLANQLQEVPAGARDMLARQVVGTGAMLGAGAIGSQLDPEDARIARSYVTNFGGQSALPANIGFAIGQALEQGKPVRPAAVSAAAGRGLPLPTTEPVTEWGNFALNPTEAPLPRGVMPNDFRALLNFLFGQ